MTSSAALDIAGRKRSPATLSGYHCGPHQLRHAHPIEMAQEGVPLNIIQRQLGHTDLGVTSIRLQGIDNTQIINAVHSRQPPMMPASAGLQL